jgi:transcriptional regulator GlxA family with amidase domain
MYDLFMSAGRDWDAYAGKPPGPPLMQPRIVAAAPKAAVAVANAIHVVPEAGLATDPAPDIICVPDLNVMPGESLEGRFEAEIAWLKTCYEQGSVIGTACSGALLLAHAGLLDGCDATTHWAFNEDLRRSYPAVKVCPGRALVTSGREQRLVMAGGGTTWLDLAVYLIARTVGVQAAVEVARVHLINWHDIGTQPYARLARSRQADDAAIGRCQEWIATHYRERAPVNAMIQLSGLPERSFKRRFQQATGPVAAAVRAHAADRGGEADARVGRRARRAHRRRGRLRGRGILQPPVPAQRRPDAIAVPAALRGAETRAGAIKGTVTFFDI